ncbi:MAG TPA: TonB-dependent receptor [Bacteriovoracaceae bacterium]|nr:TonB-dependent receptor [Bacteriovoracaceae bacterium]
MPAILLFIIFYSYSLFASENLSPIEVSTAKNAEDFYSGSVEVIDREEIRKASFNELTEILSNVSGVTASSNGGPGSRTAFFIRGAESRHTAFSLDGLRLNDASNTDRQFDGAFFNPLMLSEIKIYKGPQSILYGPDALAGLVELTTSKGNGKDETHFSFGGGSFDTYKTFLMQDWGSEKHRGRVSAGYLSTQGISRLNKKRFGATERDSTKTYQLTSTSTHQFSQWKTDFLVGYNFGESELDGFTDDNSHDTSRMNQFFIQQKSDLRLDNANSLVLRTGQSRYNRELQTLSTGVNHYLGVVTQVDFYLDHRKKGSHFIIGGGVDHEDFEIDRDFDRNNTLGSGYFSHKLSQGIYEFSYGVRFDHHQRFGDFFTYSFSPAFNLGDVNVNYLYATGLKAPSLYQLYGPPIYGFPVGNSDLKAEESVSHSVNLSWAHRLGELNMSLFSNEYKELITYSMLGYLNQDRFKVEGVELSFKGRAGDFDFRPYLTIQHFKDHKSHLLRRPENFWGLDLSWQMNQAVRLWSKFEYRGKSYDNDENGSKVKLAGYEKVDVGISYGWGPSELALRIHNIFDREYEQVYGMNVMPRSFMIEWSGKL